MKEDNVKKQIKHAAALQYSPDSDAAPRIVAAGKGQIAERIIQKAQENNVPLYQDTNLAQTLSSLSIGDEIPPEIYEVGFLFP